MKLYYAPGACSMAPHIVLIEAGYPYQLEKVDLKSKQTENGRDYTQVNPKGSVPALELDDGEILTEAAVVVQYLADQKPDSELAPKPGTRERYRLMEWLNFVSTEIHKQLAPLFNPRMTQEWKDNQLELLDKRFAYLNERLTGKQYVMDRYTLVDAYLFTVLNWTKLFKIDLGNRPELKDYMARVAQRPAVQQAMREEGLLA